MAERAAPSRTRLWVLVVLLIVLAAVAGYQVLGGSATGAVPASSQVVRSGRPETGGGEPPPEVRLEALAAVEGDDPAPSRNPFRFQARAASGPAPGGEAPTPATTGPRSAPAAPRPVGTVARPIALKFIGTVESPDSGLIAALSDGTFVFHGRKGDVIDGRYRIVEIGVESIVLEHTDGSGRQTIRLTG